MMGKCLLSAGGPLGNIWKDLKTEGKKGGGMEQSATILVVDDEDICLAITGKLIESLGLQVVTARDGVEAIEVYQQYKADIACVVLDIQMPRMDGIEALRRLKSIDSDIRVIVTSGFVDISMKSTIEQLEPHCFLDKPINIDNITKVLSDFSVAH